MRKKKKKKNQEKSIEKGVQRPGSCFEAKTTPKAVTPFIAFLNNSSCLVFLSQQKLLILISHEVIEVHPTALLGAEILVIHVETRTALPGLWCQIPHVLCMTWCLKNEEPINKSFLLSLGSCDVLCFLPVAGFWKCSLCSVGSACSNTTVFLAGSRNMKTPSVSVTWFHLFVSMALFKPSRKLPCPTVLGSALSPSQRWKMKIVYIYIYEYKVLQNALASALH